jgi:hypothetical protein
MIKGGNNMYEHNYSKLIANYLERKISNEVCIIKMYDELYILKKIVLPINQYQEKCKIDYINYLHYNGIKVGQVLEYWFEDNICYEIQEYIYPVENKKIEIDDVIITVAEYHKISQVYKGKGYNQPKYIIPYSLCDIELNKILLGFKEKYYLYSKISYESMSLKNSDILELFENYKNIFHKLQDSKRIPWFICHNDFTRNNLLIGASGNSIIDFDFGITTIPYVDFIDAILTRKYSINDINNNYDRFVIIINRLVSLYNSINNTLTLEDALRMVAVKIISFFLYVHYNEKNIKIFNENLDPMLSLLRKIIYI